MALDGNKTSVLTFPVDRRNRIPPKFLRICIVLISICCLSGATSEHVSETEVGSVGILFLSLAILITLAMSALYSGSETALVSVDKIPIEKSAVEGNERAKIIKLLTESNDRMLGMTLVGTSLANVATAQLGLILVLTFIGYSEKVTTLIGQWYITPVSLATAITTCFLLLFGEAMPKILFRNQANKLLLRYAYYLRISDLVFRPIVSMITLFPRLLTRHIGQNQHNANARREELRFVAKIGEHSGTIGREQRRMIHDVLDFQHQRVGQVMVPLVEMIAVESGTKIDDFLSIASKSGYSRIPIYQGQIFNIIGIAHILDVIYARTPHSTDSHQTIDQLMNCNLKYVPESKPIHSLLQDLKESPHMMAFIVNEYGGIVGLVTVEDLVEEIVGEFADESDHRHQTRQISPNIIECDGRTTIDSLNETFDLGIPTGDYETIAGYVLDLEKRLPTIGTQVETKSHILTVSNVDDRSIRQIRIRRKSGLIERK